MISYWRKRDHLPSRYDLYHQLQKIMSKLLQLLVHYIILSEGRNIRDKVLKNVPSKICGMQPLKKLK